MDIDLLSKMVKELILDRDKVVLPGLGSFVAEIVSSTFSDKGYTINPPYRRLFFRSKPDEGSELAAFYAASNNVEMSAAERIIKDFCTELKAVLHEKKTVIFPGLGRLRATKENHVFFVADEDLDIYPAGFGLEPVSLKTHQETKEEVSAVVADLKTIVDDAPKPVVAAPVVEEAPVDEETPVEVVEEDSNVEQAMEEDVVPEGLKSEELKPVESESEEVQEDKQEQVAEVSVVDTEEVVVQESVPVRKPWWKILLKVCMWLLIVAVILLMAYVVVGRTCPEFIDSYLYTPEELEIVRTL